MKTKKFWRFSGNESKYLNGLFTKGFKYTKKPFSQLLEEKWSKIHKLKYSICINSCTSALHIAFKAIGIKKGDEVLVPALTPIMCGTTIHLAGGTPIYVDVNPKDFLIDEKDVLKKITKNTKAILAVHMYSGICNMKNLRKICKKNNLFLIEDCAESAGAKDQNGNLTGTVGDISCWSFQSAKQLTCGDGGMLATNNKKIAEKIRKFSNLGFKVLTAENNKIVIAKDERQNPNYNRFDEIGFNYRMNEFSAAIALAQSERLNYFIKLRRKSGNKFQKIFNKLKSFDTQFIHKNSYSTYYTFAAKLNYRENKYLNWYSFRKKFMSYGGDGIYAASKLIHQEPAMKKYKIGRCFKTCKKNCILKCKGTPIAKQLQKSLFLFTTNQEDDLSVNKQINALKKTISFFDIK